MTGKSDQSKFGYVRAIHFRDAERRIDHGQYVSAEELVALLRKRGKAPVPGAVLDYIASHLAGDVQKPRGRKKLNEAGVARHHMIIRFEYKRLLALFREGKSLSDVDRELYGETPIEMTANITPAQRAARLVACAWYHGAESWKTVQNIASSQE